MADGHHTAPNPSSATLEAPQRPALYHYEPALTDLAGVASLASLFLEAVAKDDNLASCGRATEALNWLSNRLGDAAETVLAIHECREPRWQTQFESESITEALKVAAAFGAARASSRGAPSA
jgi:hypothetical protein